MTVSEKVESQSKIPSVKRPWNPTLEKTKGGVPGIRSLRNQFKKAHARALIARVIQEEFMKSTMQACMFLLMVMLALGLSACGSPATYTISGTVTNFTSAAVPLQLQNNGANTLSVTANGSFTFRSALRRGSTYNVTISVQPSSPVQTCGVTHGNGTVTGNVTDVAVDCGHNEWSWMGGSNLSNQPGTYGTQGTPAPGNIPGPRTVAGTSMDATGNVWLFGGFGGDSTGAWGSLDDLWKYSGGEWTWISGSNLGNQAGTWGTQGTPAPDNVPAPRVGAVTWTDSTGNFWLFGGSGNDSAGAGGWLNDLWKYSGGEWTWMSGSNLVYQAGTYGTQGTAAPDNTPGAREGAATWTDTTGDFWLFGGWGIDSTGTYGFFNDLWKYSGDRWTWMSGPNLINQPGTYGTQGTVAAGNIPGARAYAAWTDASGNVWLFGGKGLDSTGAWGFLNDLWKYSGGQWTWMSGSNLVNQPGSYGTQGTPAPSNVPASRNGGVAWSDAAGNFWLFGGQGRDPSGPYVRLNDFWRYSGGQWTWMKGSNLSNQPGTWGTQGTPAPDNTPRARQYAVGWKDQNGNFWLFSGDAIASDGRLLPNDLWKYEP